MCLGGESILWRPVTLAISTISRLDLIDKYMISSGLLSDMIHIQRVARFLSTSLGEGVENKQPVRYKPYQTTKT
jgi:hypothetical protein